MAALGPCSHYSATTPTRIAIVYPHSPFSSFISDGMGLTSSSFIYLSLPR
jgi:hypothetical protein